MKKKVLLNLTLILFAAWLISGCQKSIIESTGELAGRAPDASLKNKCQLTQMNVEGFNNRFHYNSIGLADEWRIDYGDGYHELYTMAYDEDNRLSRAWYHYDDELLATIEFEWTGKLLTKESWDFSGYLFDVVNIYNQKGQMIKREVSDGGYSAASEYTPNGNITTRDIFFGGELVQRGEYTYNQPNKNPFLAIQGIPYGFPFVLFDFSNWWETSEKITVFGFGEPFIFIDEDAAQTTMQLGFQDYPTAVTHFDLVRNDYFPFTFEYQNCGPENNSTAKISNLSETQSSLPINNKGRKISLLKTGPPESVRKQLEQLRKQ